MKRIDGVNAGRIRALKGLLGLFALLVIALMITAPRWAGAVLNPPPGGPILVVTSSSAPFSEYYTEILRNEGLNEFAVADLSTLSAASLAGHDVVVLGKTALTAAQVTMLSNWVHGGGHLIAMSPDAQLASLLGLTPTGTTLADGYLLIDTSTSPGAGLVGQTIQFHGSADRYTSSGATSVATLYSNASTATVNPAVSTRAVGGGTASAFTYDLATSVVIDAPGQPEVGNARARRPRAGAAERQVLRQRSR